MTLLYVKLRLLEILDQWEAPGGLGLVGGSQSWSVHLALTHHFLRSLIKLFEAPVRLLSRGWGSRRYLIMRTNYISFPELIPRSVLTRHLSSDDLSASSDRRDRSRDRFFW